MFLKHYIKNVSLGFLSTDFLLLFLICFPYAICKGKIVKYSALFPMQITPWIRNKWGNFITSNRYVHEQAEFGSCYFMGTMPLLTKLTEILFTSKYISYIKG